MSGGIIFIAVVSFWALGLLTVSRLTYAVLATPAILFGAWAGSTVFRRLAHDNVRGVVLIFLAVIAVLTLVRAII